MMHDNTTERKRKRGALEDISNTHKASAPTTRMSTRLNLKVAASIPLLQSQTSESQTQSTSPSQEDDDAPVAVMPPKKRKTAQDATVAVATTESLPRRSLSTTVSRRKSLESQTKELRDRQRMFDVHMNASSSEYDVEVYVAQVGMIDSKEDDAMAREIDKFHRSHEHKYRVQTDYLSEVKDGVKSDINCRMRGILVDWLVEVGEEYKLVPHTLHLAIHLVDRCLSIMRLARGKLQLLGCACMMIASKYEEVVAPSIEDFVYISDHTYTNEEMLAMETTVLEALEYKISGTNAYHFLERFVLAGCTTDVQKHFAHYLMELAVVDYSITITYLPSILAAAVVYMTRLVTEEKSPWTPTLHYYTKYNTVQVVECATHLYKIHNAEYQVLLTDPEKTRAITDKYSTRSHAGVGKLAPVAPPSMVPA